MRLLGCELVQFRTDRSNIIPDFPAIDVKVDSPRVGGGHVLFLQESKPDKNQGKDKNNSHKTPVGAQRPPPMEEFRSASRV